MQSVRPGSSVLPPFLLLHTSCSMHPSLDPAACGSQDLPHPCDDPCPFCHLTPFLRHIGEARIPEHSLQRSWQQLQEADPAQRLRCHSQTVSSSRLMRSLIPQPPLYSASLCAQPRAEWVGRTSGTGGGSLGVLRGGDSIMAETAGARCGGPPRVWTGGQRGGNTGCAFWA